MSGLPAMTPSTAWVMLVAAGLVDVLWATTMKLSQGYTRPGWTALSLLSLAAFVFLLGRALAVLPVGSAYAVWTGIGATGTVLAGTLLFSEALTPTRLAGVGLVMAGIVVLHASGAK
ncbi:DMT family transporter [Luteimonas lutimaris]|uniref:Guanidinium exporter n=1 Tax=Luteimonas lutimaris TaxID=698645 RepID=A0ABP7MTU7_9GAMM